MTGRRGAARRYYVRLAIVMIAYAVLLGLAVVLMPVAAGTPWRWLVMALPLPAVAGVVVVVGRYLAEADELQARIQLQALAIGFAGGSMLTFGYGLMQIAGAPALSWTFVWPVYGFCWLVGLGLARSRY